MDKQKLKEIILHLKHDVGRLNGEDAEMIKKNFSSIFHTLIKNKGRNIPRICGYYGITDDTSINMLSHAWNKFENLKNQKQGSNMFFYAEIEDEKLRDMLLKIQQHHSSKDFYFEEITKEYKQDFLKIVNYFLKTKQKLSYENRFEFLSFAHEHFYDAIKKAIIPKENVNEFIHHIIGNIYNSFKDDYRFNHGRDQFTDASHVTRAEAYKVTRWLDEYHQQHRTYPTIEQIAQHFDLTEETVRKYIAISKLPVHLEDKADSVEKFETPFLTPHEKYEEKELKNFMRHVVDRIQKKLYQEEVSRLHGDYADVIKENWVKIFYKMFRNHGVNLKPILQEYEMDEKGQKQLQRIWKKFVEIMGKDKELKEYMRTARKYRMNKVAKILYSNEFEDKLIKKIIKK